MRRALRRRFYEALERRPLDSYLAVQSTWWGLWALSPWDAFGVLPAAYTVLAFFPEWAWGAVFAAHGATHLVALCRDDVETLARASLSLQYLWAIVAFNYLATVPLSLATPTYGMLFLGSLWAHSHHLRKAS